MSQHQTELSSLLETIKKKKSLANQRSDGLDPRTRNTKVGQIKRAKEDLKQLYREYRTAVQNQSVFILLTGTKKQIDSFTKTASEGFGCFPLEGESLYRDIVEQVPEVLYTNKMSSPNLFDHLSARFEDRAIDIEIVGYFPLTFESKYKTYLNNKEDAVQLFKKAFNEKIGSEVVGLDAVDKVADRAVNTEYEGKVVPILMYSSDVDFISDLKKNLRKVSKNVMVVGVGSKLKDDVKKIADITASSGSKENVEKSLVKVKEALK